MATPCGKWGDRLGPYDAVLGWRKDFLLLYRTSGSLAISRSVGPSFGAPVALGAWENDWAHIEIISTFMDKDSSFWSGETARRLPRGSTLVSRALALQDCRAARGPGVTVDTPVRLGQWETDWAKIRAFMAAAFHNCCSTGQRRGLRAAPIHAVRHGFDANRATISDDWQHHAGRDLGNGLGRNCHFRSSRSDFRP